MTVRSSGRTLAAAIAISAIVVAGSACRTRRPTSHVVRIENFTFVPAAITVAPGDTIVWINADIVPHTATARDSTWDSPPIAGGNGSYRYVARTPGRHAYFCTAHPTMTGVVEVR